MRPQRTRSSLTAGIGVVAGLSYWVRYHGLFLVGGAGIYLIVRAWRIPRSRRGAFAGLLAAAALAGSVQLRNAVYTGSWRGAFNNNGRQVPRTVIVQTLKAFFHLVTGDRVPAHLDVGMGILLLSAALTLVLGIRALIVQKSRNNIEPLGWTLFIGFAYIGGVVVAALTTIADDLPRYFFPVYPLFLACAAVACSAIAKGMKSLVVAVLLLALLAIQARNLFVRPTQPDWILTRAMMAEEVQPGITLTGWLRNNLAPDGAILAVEGQAVHYVLQRPVVAVIPAVFSGRITDEQGFRSEMRQFRSRYLLLFPTSPPDRIPEQYSYGFLQSLAAGNAPAWLKLAVRTRGAAVYECADCFSAQPNRR